ncbi:MAG: hypothetical protein JW941_09360 [Candidatus Coatesbacteria bacterium]|nr:hypothetical protein [Candidatus Coatesbacteria bacterium]
MQDGLSSLFRLGTGRKRDKGEGGRGVNSGKTKMQVLGLSPPFAGRNFRLRTRENEEGVGQAFQPVQALDKGKRTKEKGEKSKGSTRSKGSIGKEASGKRFYDIRVDSDIMAY